MDKIGLQAVLDDRNFQDGLKRYTQGVSQMTHVTDSAAAAISGAFKIGTGIAVAGIAGLTAAMKIGLDTTLAWGEGINDLGDQFGMTGEQASGFQYLANKVGVSVGEMGIGLKSITNGLQGVEDRLKTGSKAVSPFEQGLSKLGLSAFNAKGKLKTFDDLLPELMDAFKKLPPGIKASSIAMDLFGTRGGSKFLDFLREGSEGLEDARKKAKAFGLELSTEESDAAEQFSFAMNELNLGLKGFWNQIGRQVLPIARRFVDFINTKIIPALSAVAKRYAPLLGAALEKISDALGHILTGFSSDWNQFIQFIDRAFGREAANNVGQFINAAGGVVAAIGNIANAFKSGGMAGGLQALGTQLANAFKNIDWSAVAKGLDKLKTQFWEWLTGKNGVISQVAGQLGRVVTEIGKWLSNPQNTQPIVNAVLSWVDQFWKWLTDANGGAIATVAKQMGKLVSTIREWSEAETTKQQFRDIGKTIANTILDGIGRIFENPAEGRNLLVELANTIRNAYESLRQTFANIGTSIAQGVVEGIANRFFGPETAQRLASALDGAFHALFNILSAPGGPIMGLAQRIAQTVFNALQSAFNALIGNWNPSLPATGGSSGGLGTAGGSTGTGGGGGSSGFAFGGPVNRTGMAMVHAGEFVLNRRQVAALAPMLTRNTTNNNYSFSNTWNGAVSGADRGSVEKWAEDAAYRGIRRAMGTT